MHADSLQLIAHRGIPRRYPENSLVGLEAAMRAAIPYVEFDIQVAADGELVLSHDTSLLRTGGADASLFDLSWNQLREFDVGQRQRFGARFAGTRIPRLTDVVALAQDYPNCRLMVEIKPASLERHGRASVLDGLMQRLQPVLERCILISFDHTALQALRARQPRCRLGWVVKRLDTAEFERAGSLRPDLIIASTKLLRPDRPPWPGPWQWAVYSINDAALARAYADAGILLVETDDAERMALVLAG